MTRRCTSSTRPAASRARSSTATPRSRPGRLPAIASSIGATPEVSAICSRSPRLAAQRVPLTNDSAIDWSPVWSPDGRDVYFSSDRGGAMNLWRMPVDPSTGKALGAPEPVTMGAQASSGLPSFSKDGKRLAFRSRDRLDQSVRDSVRSRHAQGGRAAPARLAHEHSRAQRRLAGRDARGVLRHRRAAGGSVRRPARRGHAPRDRRCRRAIARRCSRRTASHWCSIPTAAGSGRRGSSAWMAAGCGNSGRRRGARCTRDVSARRSAGVLGQ